jgi:aryl-alcohol dehydrogenase-like predicted oxidoreductase
MMSFVQCYESGGLGAMVLGAVQLGLNYGVANKAGKPSRESAYQILLAAWEHGVRAIDTAQAYGDSEEIIAEYLERFPEHNFHVFSKISPGVDHRDAAAVLNAARNSYQRFSRPLASLMMHNADAIHLWGEGLGRAMKRCLDEGFAENLGVSIYTPGQFQAALQIPELRVIQAPFNVLDRRLLDSGLLDRALDSGRVIVLRSLYLQGLLLIDVDKIPVRMSFAAEDLGRWESLCASHTCAKGLAAMQYVRHAVPRALLVIGCERTDQLLSNLSLLASTGFPAGMQQAIEKMKIPDEQVINPSLWPKL